MKKNLFFCLILFIQLFLVGETKALDIGLGTPYPTSKSILANPSLLNANGNLSGKVYIKGNFTVNATITFETAKVTVAANKSVNITNGKKLSLIVVCEFSASTATMWNGFNVQNGSVLSCSGTTIQDAKTAITVTLGTINLSENRFINNYIGIETKCQNAFGRFDNNLFTWSALKSPRKGEKSYAGVQLGLGGIETIGTDGVNTFENHVLGITGAKVNLKVRHCRFVNISSLLDPESEIEGIGIFLHKSTVNIEGLGKDGKATFENCYRAGVYTTFSNTTIKYCRNTVQWSYGYRIEEASEVTVNENRFDVDDSEDRYPFASIYVTNKFVPNLKTNIEINEMVYNNSVGNFGTAIWLEGNFAASNALISYNIIKGKKFSDGIYVLGQKYAGSGTMTILGNTFEASDGLTVNDLPPHFTVYSTSGILLEDVKQKCIIQENVQTFLDKGAWGIGLWGVDNPDNLIKTNHTYCKTIDETYCGLHIQDTKGEFCENLVDYSENGVHIFQNCVGAKLKSTEFNTHKKGLYIKGKASMLGEQPRFHNMWLDPASYSQYAAFFDDCDYSKSLFFIEVPEAPTIPRLYPDPRLPAGNKWFKPKSGEVEACSKLLNQPELQCDYYNELDHLIGEGKAENKIAVNGWNLDRYLYEKIKLVESENPCTDFTDFIKVQENTNIGRLYTFKTKLKQANTIQQEERDALEKMDINRSKLSNDLGSLSQKMGETNDEVLLATYVLNQKEATTLFYLNDSLYNNLITAIHTRQQKLFEEAKLLLNEIPNDNTFVEYEKTVYDILLTSVTTQEGKITEAQNEQLRKIAALSYEEGGSATSSAQFLLPTKEGNLYRADNQRKCLSEEGIATKQTIHVPTVEAGIVVLNNPVQTELQLRIGNETADVLTLTNTQGKQMIHTRIDAISKSFVKLDISNLSNGVYFCTISQQGKRIATQKVIIQH
jgi:hypothetical protein